MNATDAQTAIKMLRNLRDPNRGDKDLVRICNETILIIRNLQKEEAFDGPHNREAAKHLRAKLKYNMDWLERKRPS